MSELLNQIEKDIRLLAFCKWHDAGRPDGDGQEFWLAAEKEIHGSNNKPYEVFIDDGTKYNPAWKLTTVT